MSKRFLIKSALMSSSFFLEFPRSFLKSDFKSKRRIWEKVACADLAGTLRQSLHQELIQSHHKGVHYSRPSPAALRQQIQLFPMTKILEIVALTAGGGGKEIDGSTLGRKRIVPLSVQDT